MTDEINQASAQAIIDAEHLKLLSISYILSGAMSVFASLIGLVYAGMGLFVSLMPHRGAQDGPPAEIGLVFGIIGGLIFCFMLALAAAKFWAAWSIKRRRSPTLCKVVAAISCLGIPWGTAIGVWSLIVLSRKSVMALFTAEKPAAP